MPSKDDVDHYSGQETAERLRKVLKGAFSGPPTPLKELPTKQGKVRKSAKSSASRANAKTAPPES